MKAKVEAMIMRVQAEIIRAIEEVELYEGGKHFQIDRWMRKQVNPIA